MFELVAALILAFIVRRMWIAERRRLRIGVLGALAAWLALEGVLDVLGGVVPAFDRAVLILAGILLLPALMVVLAVFLLLNGVQMFRRESRSFANGLSALAGLGLLGVLGLLFFLLVPALAAGVVVGVRAGLLAGVSVLTVLLTGYAGVFFLIFLVYGRVYRRSSEKLSATAIVVHGSGLIGDRVPPLLAARLDRGMEVFRRSEAAGKRPLLIPSGGKGDDENRPEGEAMREYLLAAGVPSDRVIAETQSKTTEENLLFSAPIIAKHAEPGQTIVVTSEYHAFRAALLAKRVKFPGEAVGAKTARYYVPSALLREFIAIAMMNKPVQIGAVALSVLLAALVGLVAGVA